MPQIVVAMFEFNSKKTERTLLREDQLISVCVTLMCYVSSVIPWLHVSTAAVPQHPE